jgi:hypothetical protein
LRTEPGRRRKLWRVKFQLAITPSSYGWFFLGPTAGGIEIKCAGELVTVITTGSPLGNQILGKKVGDLLSAPKAKIESLQ